MDGLEQILPQTGHCFLSLLAMFRFVCMAAKLGILSIDVCVSSSIAWVVGSVAMWLGRKSCQLLFLGYFPLTLLTISFSWENCLNIVAFMPGVLVAVGIIGSDAFLGCGI